MEHPVQSQQRPRRLLRKKYRRPFDVELALNCWMRMLHQVAVPLIG